MNYPLVISIATLAIAVLGHAFATIWWAAKVTYSLDSIKNEIKDIKEEFKEEGIAQKLEIKALWKRVDENRERIVTIETKNKLEEI